MSSANESNTNSDNKVVHTSVEGRRYYHVDNDETKRRKYCCTGKDDTCTNKAHTGGLCNGCGEPRTHKLCKRVIDGGSPCPNQVILGGFCRTHNPNPPVCQGVNDDDSPCPNRAIAGGLCERHGRRYVKCPCGRDHKTCRECNPLGNLVGRIRGALYRATKRFIQGKSLGRAEREKYQKGKFESFGPRYYLG